MNKKTLVLFLAIIMTFALLAGCGSTVNTPNEPAGSTGTTTETTTATTETTTTTTETTAKKGVLLMATTTSTDNTGLLDYLAPVFLEDTGWELKWTAVGTGEALALGKNGDADILLVHAKAKEEEFVKEGSGIERFQVMYNDFIIVGPTDGPIKKTSDIESVFKQIQEEKLVFVSRGDDSGTHTKETGIWGKLGIDYKVNPNYISAGAGMSDTIIMTDEKKGYCLSDRGTWLSTKSKADNKIGLEIICEGDPNLLNQYGVIAVSQKVNPDTNLEGANAFIEWICSAEIQKLIGSFGVDEYGEALFTPNAIAK